QFKLFSTKILDEFHEAKQLGILTKPVIIGPVSYLLLGKEKEEGFERIELLKNLLPVYLEILNKLKDNGVEWVQFDEPFLAMDLNEKEKAAFTSVYTEIRKKFPAINILVATYFEGLRDNTHLAASLPITALHIDLIRCPEQLDEVLNILPPHLQLSLGIVDGRNVWKNDFNNSLGLIDKVVHKIGTERVLIAPSCSLLHSPCDLTSETNELTLTPEIKQWLSFARQKINEVKILKELADGNQNSDIAEELKQNQISIEARKVSLLIHNPLVKERVRS